MFDPFLREALYEPQKLEPFEKFYKEQLKLRKMANTPDNKKPNFKERPNDFKKGSLVYIDFLDDYQVSSKYNVKHGPIYEISEVNTLQNPYLYKLRDMHTEKETYGWYYSRELSRADLSTDLKTKTLKSGKVLIYCKFKQD